MLPKAHSTILSSVVLWLTPLLILLCLGITGSPSYADETAYIEVQAAKLRAQPKVWAPPIADLHYGDKVQIVSREDPWLRVRSADQREGYLHVTALTTRTVVLKGEGSQSAAVDISDAVLAGKGFNADVASRYVSGSLEGGFQRVEAMQKSSRVDDKTLLGFMRAGNLNLGERK